MRKIAALFFGSLVVCTFHTSGQSTALNSSPVSRISLNSGSTAGKDFINALNIKAVRHFYHAYGEASHERWSRKADGYRVCYEEDHIRYLVDYDKKGNWKSTIRIYGEHQLPEDIRRSVRTIFLDYSIVTVSELKLGNILSYFVKLEDKNTLKTIRIINGEMNVVEDYIK